MVTQADFEAYLYNASQERDPLLRTYREAEAWDKVAEAALEPMLVLSCGSTVVGTAVLYGVAITSIIAMFAFIVYVKRRARPAAAEDEAIESLNKRYN